jgi:hypothetical protein
MLWFKHKGTFRNSPPMRYIADALGDRGVAAAYRLYEVMTERFGLDDDFSGTIVLSRPLTLRWLGREIATPTKDGANCYDPTLVTDEEVLKLLAVFHEAQLIDLTSQVDESIIVGDDGVEKEAGQHRFYSITVTSFRKDCADETMQRKANKAHKKGLNTPE